MKAAVYERYGPPDVIEIREVPTPRPADDEILIRTRATTVTSGDWRARTLEMPPGFGLLGRLVFGVSQPRQPILGSEIAGDVAEVGRDVTRFKVGDPVFGFTGAGMGCHAEYRTMAASAVAPKPGNLTYDEAAALSFGGTTALDFFRRGQLRRGETVLINGASGAVGSAAVQLAARHFGARVTGVCSGGNADLVKSLGAERVIDYTKEDFTASGERYDVIVDTAGTAPFARSSRSLTDRGRCLLVLGGLADLLRVPWVSLTSRRKIVAGPAPTRPQDVQYIAGLAEAGEFRPVIGGRYAFQDIAQAHQHVATGHKRGNVVVTLAGA